MHSLHEKFQIVQDMNEQYEKFDLTNLIISQAQTENMTNQSAHVHEWMQLGSKWHQKTLKAF